MSRTSALLLGATAFAAVGLVMAQTFTVNTPASLITCQPYNIMWTGGVAPFFPSITQPGEISQIIEQFAQTNENNYLWKVNVAAGSKVTIVVGDSQGMQALSGISPAIVAGADTSCVGQSASSSAPSSTSGSSTSSSGSTSSTSASATTPASSTSSSSSSAASSPTSQSSSSSSSATRTSTSTSASATASPNAATKVSDYSAIVAGIVGVVAAALI